MEIAITGHTSPLGKVLYEHLSKEHNVRGFSRVNGYEMPLANDKIIRETVNVDVFINCAYPLEKNAKGSLAKYSRIQNTFLEQLYNKHYFGKGTHNVARFKARDDVDEKRSILIISLGSSFIHIPEAEVATQAPGTLGFWKAKKEHAQLCQKKYLCELQLGAFAVKRDESGLEQFSHPVDNIVPVVDFVMDSYFNKKMLIHTINMALMT